MSEPIRLLDASAFTRIGSPHLAEERRSEIRSLIARGLIASSTPLMLETRAGRDLPTVDTEVLHKLWITERAEQRAVDLQRQMRAAHQHLGIPPMDYLVAAIAEDHGAVLLHYDGDFERLAVVTDLSIAPELLAPLGSLP